jgi:predicted nuclease of predicted toxin-antitoxin system
MKVLFDVNMPRPLRRELGGSEVVTAQSMGWGELENGELIDAAEKAGFNVLVTADRNLQYQQNLSGRRIGIVVLPGNKLRELKSIGPKIREILDAIKPGDFIEL